MDEADPRARLGLLAAVDGARAVFGAHEHDYVLAPPLGEEALTARERALGVALPAAYRSFLATVGASGAGPYYGLATFAAQDAWRASHLEAEVSADPARPFSRSRGTLADPGAPWSLDGAVLLAEQGCGHQSLLVVSGPARGEVWTGFDFGLGGLVPEASDFTSWYRGWLDRALFEWARGRLRALALEGGATEDERRAVALVRPIVQARAAEPDVGPLRPGDSLRTLGDLLLLDGDARGADAAYAKAAELDLHDPAAQLHLDRARVRRMEARWDAALEEARAGLAAQPRSLGRRHELHTEAELALLGLGRRDEAIAAMEARAAADASYPDLHRRLARAQCAAGDLDGAHHTLLRALERSVGCYASPAEIGAALAAGEGMPKPPSERRVAEIYDAFVDALRGDDPASAASLAARRPGGS